VTTNAGVTWTSNIIATGQPDGLPQGYRDEMLRFDDFGNLFLSYLGSTFTNGVHFNTNVVLALSTNGGFSFSVLTNYSSIGYFDKPVLAIGPGGVAATGSVWLAFKDVDSGKILVTGAAVTNLGKVLSFLAPTNLPLSNADCNKANVAVGPTGQVAASYVEFHSDYFITRICTNLHGLQSPTWQCSTSFTNNLSQWQIPAISNSLNHVSQEGFLAFDRSSGPYQGRLYLTYTEILSTNNMDNTDIFLRYSIDNGAN
jgi:hypothetical protein